MQTNVEEARNRAKEELEIPPSALQDTSPNIYNGDEQQIEALQAIFGPILKFMKLGGIYFGDTSFKRLGQPSTTGSKKKISIARIYCIVVVGSFWFSLAMSFVSLWVEGFSDLQNVYSLIGFCMWSFVSAIVATTCLFVLPLNVGKKSRFEKFVQNLIERRVDLATLKLYTRKGLILAIFILVVSTLNLLVALQWMPDLTLAFHKPWKDWYGFRIFWLASVIFSCVVWLLPTLFFCLTCLVLERQFDLFCKRVSLLDSHQTLDITALKKEHQKLCETVSLADKVFSPVLLEVISITIPLLCFNFYTAINPPMTIEGGLISFSIIGVVYWLLGSAAILSLITIFGSRVNEKVRKLRSNVKNIIITKSKSISFISAITNEKFQPVLSFDIITGTYYKPLDLHETQAQF